MGRRFGDQFNNHRHRASWLGKHASSCAFAGLLVLSLQFLTTPAVAAQLTLVADAHVNSAQPDVNSGTISNLTVGGGYNTYLQFDLSTLPANVTASKISKAILRLYANRVTTAGAVTIAPVGANWGEFSITYSSQPATGSAAGTIQVPSADQFLTVDVTALVQAWVTTPASNFGLALTAGTAVVQFDSKENDITSHPPTLEVELVDAGPQGPAGANGVTGPTGPAGSTGPQGPAGQTGPTGPQGPQGPAGAGTFAYQGSYQSTTAYAQGAVVVLQGSSYISLLANNRGNTPSFSTSAWGILSAQGPEGVAGPTGATGTAGPQGLPGSVGPNGPPGPAGPEGIAGQAGAQGITGATGATGSQGPMGPQGPAGPVGISFQGGYQSVTNYALADGVSYKGSGYVSLVANNYGNAPDQSPSQWALFAEAGSPGAAGAAGPQGATGAAGPAGPMGPAGPTGATGATGPQGSAVANYTGSYDSSSNYAMHDAVSWQGSTWVSLQSSNRGNTPDQSPSWWALLAAQGPAGPAGAVGLQGPPGVNGVTGATGPAGSQGPPVSFLGQWDIARQYGLGDAVSYSGSSYIALSANAGREPDLTPQFWALLAASGVPGAAGSAGAQGAQGPMGYAGPAGAPGATGPAGATGAIGPQGPPVNFLGAYSSSNTYAIGDTIYWNGSSYISLTASNRGQTPDQTPSAWSLLAAQGTTGHDGQSGATGGIGPQGPAGPAGAIGATGPAGAPGINFRGAWVTGAGYSVNDAVTLGGSTYLAQVNNSSSQPDLYPQVWAVLASAGVPGPTGPAGITATVTVGSVTTGQPGTQASVTNSGNSTAAVLNFVIPQGAAGSSGTGTTSGGGPFAATYHAVSFSSTYYSLTNVNSSLTETSTVLSWIPAACTATQLSVFSQQANAVTVTLRAGLPGAMSNSGLACSASSGSSCTSTGSVAVPAGDFLDLSITGSNGTASPVWTAVTCQ